MITVSTIHRKNCVRATRATPIILPNMRSTAWTDEMSTSTTREDFSSMTLCITMEPNMVMNMKITMPSTREITM